MQNRIAYSLVSLTLSIAFAATNAFAWGVQGHKGIAQYASDEISDSTRSSIRPLLKNGATLSSIAIWLDDVRSAARKSGPLVDDPEAIAFNKNFKKNGDWHFVDQPLATVSYEDDGPFSSQNDVVHALNRAIAVLEAPGKTPHYSRAQALRVLVHLVGDLHQPLHDGCGYYELHGTKATLIEDPAAAVGKPEDRGGNQLCYGKDIANCDGAKLHGYWDSVIVEKVAGGSSSKAKLVAAIEAKLADPEWKAAHQDALSVPAGDYHKWAEVWAGQSAHQARHAYEGIKFGKASASGHQLNRTAITLPSDYEKAQIDRAATQLVAAAVHLKELLDRIQWR